MSFRLKTILGIAAIELIVLMILITVNQLNLGGSASAQLFERAQSTGKLFATMAADAVISTDLATLDALIANAVDNEELVYLRVRSNSGAVLSKGGDETALEAEFFADSNFDAALNDHRIDVSAPIGVAGTLFGFVELGISTQRVEEEIATAFRLNVFVAGMGMTLVAIFGYILGSVLTRQLVSLQSGARMIAAGNLNHRIPIIGRDELSLTAKSFNDMAGALAVDRSDLEKKQRVLLEKKSRVNRIVGCMSGIATGGTEVEVPDQERPDEIGDMARATEVFRTTMAEIQAARLEQARLIRAIDQVSEHVAVFGTDDRLIFANESFRTFNEAFIGDLRDDFTVREFLEAGIAHGFFPGAKPDPEHWLRRRLTKRGGASGQPVEMRCGKETTLVVRRTEVAGIGSVISASDISELRQSQAQLMHASKLATLGEMATGVAHELNQPLGVIRMAAANSVKVIDRGKLDAEYLTGKLKRIEEQTERAAQIIKHMRIFGRNDNDAAKPFDTAPAFENVRNLMTRQLQTMDVALTIEEPDGPVWTTGQPVLFEQVLINLISNARDAIVSNRAEGQSGGRVDIRAAIDGPNLALTVCDTGGGIPEEALDRLFEPFFTMKEPGKGTGLGLSISYGTIRDMGGTISVANNPEGACFSISLPLAQPEQAAKAS